MITMLRKPGTLFVLLLVFTMFSAGAQPVLPDITSITDKGVVLLSWTCQYDGVKSIAVLRSRDSSFNYSTIGYVKNLIKGTQAFADGHPNAGNNFYKLAIVFNSGLTWSTNHTGIDVPAVLVKDSKPMPSNEALQKMIVTEPAKPATPVNNHAVYNEVLTKDTIIPKPKLKLTFKNAAEEEAYLEALPEATRKKVIISYPDSSASVKAADNGNSTKKPEEEKKKLVLTFNDVAEEAAYVEALPPAIKKKATVVVDSTPVKATAPAIQQQPEAVPKPRIRIAFNDDVVDNVSTTVKSRYISVDQYSGNVNLTLPDDIATHHYSIKFYDKENHVVIEVPKLNTAKIILDKRNFQKKGVYKFAIRKDILELERGYITIY